MSGFFGVAANADCVADLYYGTDYHSHLGTMRGGLATWGPDRFTRFIHDITNTQFRSKFEDDLAQLHGNLGIGVISDYEDQPLIIGSHLGTYALATVGRILNLDQLAAEAFRGRTTHFSEMGGTGINPTELVATLINRQSSFAAGIEYAQHMIKGSCSLLLLTDKAIYAARDRLGRTPVVIGRKPGAYAATLETCALPNLDYEVERYLGPGEIVRMTADGVETLRAAGKEMQICSFLWVYYGYPASSYEGINVEAVRYRCGEALARADDIEVDIVAGIPDSGTGHAIGYANESGVPYVRPFVKYTPTWPRSFMPQDQRVRDLVAQDETDPHPRGDSGETRPVLRRFHRPRHAAARYRPAVVRVRGQGSPHAAGLSAAGPRLQVPQLLPIPLGIGLGRAAGHQGVGGRGRQALGRLRRPGLQAVRRDGRAHPAAARVDVPQVPAIG